MDFTTRIRKLLGVAVAMGALSFCAAGFAQAPAAKAPTGPGSLNGLWTQPNYKGSRNTPPRDRVFKTVDGKWPPLRPEPAKLLEERIKMTERGTPYQNTLMQCLPGGVPEMTFGSPYPIQFVESPGQVTILYEMYNHFRVVYLNAKHPEDPDPTFMGHSVGHWEGNTLVVDTVGLTDRTVIDEVGIPHSDELHVIERYTRTDANTLEVVVTIDDPKTFTEKWDTKTFYKRARSDQHFIEYICENNRSARE